MNQELITRAHQILDIKDDHYRLLRSHNNLYPVIGESTPVHDLEKTLKHLLREILKANEEFYPMYDMVESTKNARLYLEAIEILGANDDNR